MRAVMRAVTDGAGHPRRSARRGRRAAAVATVLAVALVLGACGGGDTPPDATGDPAPGGPSGPAPSPGTDDRPRSPFTGLPVDPEVLARPLLAVKIDNHASARPQSGMDVADIVIEEVVEAGLTRFMALLHGQLPEVVGPVRSARPVDVDLLSGFGASGFVYSGARPEVQGLLTSVPSVRVVHLDDIHGFFRDEARPRPYNLYIRAEETLQRVIDLGGRPLIDIGWVFDAVAPPDPLVCPPATPTCPDPGASVVIEMSNAFRTGWTYDAAAGVYRRQQNGRAFTASGSGDIGAANVVVLATRHYLGASGYPETDATTTGAPAIVLRDGRRYAARWVKPTASDLLLIQTLDGAPFPLKPGTTWLHLPSSDRMPAVG